MPKKKPGTGPKPSISPPERYPSGDPKPAAGDERGNAPVLVRRIMDHAVNLGADPRCATVLGRLHLEGFLTETEFAAGLLYAEDVGAYERIKGHPRRHARSPSFDAGYGRAELDLEALERMDPEAADKAKRRIERSNRRIVKRHEKAQLCIPGPRASDFDVPDEYTAMSDGTKTGRRPVSLRAANLISTIVEEVCCNDRPVHMAHRPTLKAVLGRLAKDCYRLHEPAARAPKRQAKPLTRAELRELAEATVEAMEEWFRKRRATIAFYRVQHRHDFQSRIIVGYGVGRDGAALENAITLRRPAGTKGPHIDEALAEAAVAKGWAFTKAPTVNEIDQAALTAALAKLKGEAA